MSIKCFQILIDHFKILASNTVYKTKAGAAYIFLPGAGAVMRLRNKVVAISKVSDLTFYCGKCFYIICTVLYNCKIIN
jgi:hypothetical protein